MAEVIRPRFDEEPPMHEVKPTVIVKRVKGIFWTLAK